MKVRVLTDMSEAPEGSVLEAISHKGSVLLAEYNGNIVPLLYNEYSIVYNDMPLRGSRMAEVTSNTLTLTLPLDSTKKRHVRQIKHESGRVYKVDVRLVE